MTYLRQNEPKMCHSSFVVSILFINLNLYSPKRCFLFPSKLSEIYPRGRFISPKTTVEAPSKTTIVKLQFLACCAARGTHGQGEHYIGFMTLLILESLSRNYNLAFTEMR
jgi:hypothetical protein